MPSHQHLREFIRERLTAAAEEIFSEFEKTIVRYEEELSQRRLLDTSRTHEIPEVHSTDLPQQHDCKEEEGVEDQQVCNQERNSSLDPEPSQIKEEQEELGTSQEGEQHVLQQDTGDIVVWAGEEPDIMCKPERNLNRMDLPQLHDCKEEEGLDDQQVCNQERNSNLDQEDPEGAQIKEELEELGTNQEGEQLALKLETKGTIVWAGEELGVMWKPEIKLKRIVFPQHKCKEELVLTDQQVCNQERNSSVDQEDPELPHIKGEQEELCLSQKGEELVQKPETDTFPAHDKGDHNKPEPDRDQLLSEAVEEGGEDDKSRRNKCEEVITDPSSHTYEKPYLCGVCGKGFRRLTDVKRHMRSHTGEKPYSCSTCGKKFGHMANLKRHMRSHTGEKPHSCSTCGRRFTRMASLNIHTRIHTGEKPHSCNVCGKRFNYIKSLKTHMRIHTGEKPYSCTTCGKKLSCLTYLKTHMRTHTGEKPYSCSTCGKSFNQRTLLKTHVKIHTGEKPYSCTTCGKRLRCMAYLKRHMRMSHR